MKFFSEDSISVQQFKHFKKSLTKALDKQLALNKSFNVSDKEFAIKYPFLKELKDEISKTNHKVEQIDSMAVILNNYFNSAWKDKGKESIKLKRNLEKDLEQILFLIYKEKVEKSEETEKSGILQIKNTPITLKQKKSELQKKQLIKNVSLFDKFIISLENFIYLNYETFQFNLAEFENIKGRIPGQNWAYYTLIVFFHEEIIKEKGYMKTLKSDYFMPINTRIPNINNHINNINWSTFRKRNIKESNINNLKNSEFYKSLLEFRNKTT